MAWSLFRKNPSEKRTPRVRLIAYDAHGNPVRRIVREGTPPVPITRIDMLNSLNKIRVFFSQDIHALETAMQDIHTTHTPHLKQALRDLQHIGEYAYTHAQQAAIEGLYAQSVRSLWEVDRKMTRVLQESMHRAKMLHAKLYQEEARVRRLEKHFKNIMLGLAGHQDSHLIEISGRLIRTLMEIQRTLREYGSEYYQDMLREFQRYERVWQRVKHMPLHEDWTRLRELLDELRLFIHAVKTMREMLEEYDARQVRQEQQLFLLERDVGQDIQHLQEAFQRA